MNNRLNLPVIPDARCQQEARKLWGTYDPAREELFWNAYQPLIEVARQHAQEAVIVKHQTQQVRQQTVGEAKVSEKFIHSRRHSFLELFYVAVLVLFAVIAYKAHIHRQSPQNPGLARMHSPAMPSSDHLPKAVSQALYSHPTTLDLGYLKLRKVPAEVSDLIKLEALYLNDNQLMFLPAELKRLPKLQHLNASKNQIFTLSGIEKYKRLRSLYLQHNSIRSLPKNFGDLYYLETLFLEHNQLTHLPASIRYLKSLKSLYLGENSLTYLPHSIGELRNLRALYLEHNKLGELPSSIAGLKNLEFLDLEGNKLISIPPQIAGMTSLMRIDLSYNYLIYITSSIRNLQQLYKLDLSYNQLKALPPAFKQLTRLKELNLKGNPMSRATVAKIRSWLPNCRVIF